MFDIEQLAAWLAARQAAQPDACLLMAIDGPGCAGKSTLAAELAGACGAQVVHMDDFYRVMAPDRRAALDAAQGCQLYFDWERLRREVLIPLSAGSPARFRRYDWANNALGVEVLLPAAGLILVEGVYTLRPELRPFYAAAAFIHLSRALRETRAVARGENSMAWIRRWMAAEDYYLATYQPAAAATWIFDGGTMMGVME